MPGGDKRHGKEPAAAAAEDKFPDGMRVLAVDNDPVSLSVLEVLLHACKFNPTIVMDASTALRILRKGGKENFDLVITDVHMPDMDGFELVQIIVLEMDLPVIALSVNGDMETVMKGMAHGASACLVKPVPVKQIENIWHHVIRKKLRILNHNSSDSHGVYQRVQPVIVDSEKGGKSLNWSSKTKNDGDGSDENKGRISVATRTKQRLSWTSELHRKFLEAVNQLGVDNAVPKKILQMMNVDYLTRESVASHLQKYRLYLKRFTNEPRKSNPLGDSFERWNSCYYMNLNHLGNSNNYHKQQRGWPSSTVGFRGSNNPYVAPSLLGAQGASMQSMKLPIGTMDHGRGMLRYDVPGFPNTRRRHTFGPPIRSFAKISDHTMLDAFPPTHSSKVCTSVLRKKLLELSNVGSSSHPGHSSFAEIPYGAEPVNQFPVKPPELVSQLSSRVNTSPSMVIPQCDAKFPYLVESSSNPWHKYMAPSNFRDHMDGSTLAQLHVNVPQINQLQSFGSSPSQMPMIQNEQQNQMEGIINNNTLADALSEPMTPLFDMASNTSPIEMRSDNFSPMNRVVNGESSSSLFPNLQTSSSVVAPTEMVDAGTINPAFPDLQDNSIAPMQILNPEDASGILPMQEGPVNQQVIGDQLDYNDPFFLDDIFASLLNEDFNEDGAFFAGEW